MTFEQAVTECGKRSVANQLKMLSAYGTGMTIVARDAYRPANVSARGEQCLEESSKLLHRVFGHISALINVTRERYPDEVLLNIVWRDIRSTISVGVGHGAWKRS